MALDVKCFLPAPHRLVQVVRCTRQEASYTPQSVWHVPLTSRRARSGGPNAGTGNDTRRTTVCEPWKESWMEEDTVSTISSVIVTAFDRSAVETRPRELKGDTERASLVTPRCTQHHRVPLMRLHRKGRNTWTEFPQNLIITHDHELLLEHTVHLK